MVGTLQMPFQIHSDRCAERGIFFCIGPAFSLGFSLADWLVKYNSVRPHKGLGLKTPMQYIIENNPQCNMWWTHTGS